MTVFGMSDRRDNTCDSIRLKARRVHDTTTPPRHPRQLPRPSPPSPPNATSLPAPPLPPSSNYLRPCHPPRSPHPVSASPDAHRVIGRRLQELSHHRVIQSTDHAKHIQGQGQTQRRRVR